MMNKLGQYMEKAETGVSILPMNSPGHGGPLTTMPPAGVHVMNA